MKWSLLFLAFASTASVAQNANSDLPQKLKAPQRFRKGTRLDQLAQTNVQFGNFNGRNFFGSNVLDSNIERKVIPLPQDNMPCVVPNMKLYKVMPNAGDSMILKYPVDPGIYIRKYRNPTDIKK